MKKLFFTFSLITFASISSISLAQNHLISFAGTGESITIDSVKVENLTTGDTITLKGNDFLRLTGTLGVPQLENYISSAMRIFPNPMLDNATLEIFAPVEGDAIITIYEMTGKVITQVHSFLETSMQEFSISGIVNGLYLINVRGNSYHISCKLLCNGIGHGVPGIEKDNKSYKPIREITSKKEYTEISATIDMQYSEGDRLKFTASSVNFRTVKTDTPTQDKKLIFNFMACQDGDNNSYPVVEIGTQTWMAENLKTTSYSNEDLIGTTTPVTLDISAETEPKYQWAHNGNESNAATFGRLYTWYTTTDSRSICPNGWHIPTDAEWKILEMNLGMTIEQADAISYRGTDQGTQLKNTSGWIFEGNETNASGFSAIPGGFRFSDGPFNGLGFQCVWWTSTEYDSYNPWVRSLIYNRDGIDRNGGAGQAGFSVRCVKD